MPEITAPEEKARCRYCGAERPKSEMKWGYVIARDRDSRGKAIVVKREGWYCADKPCNAHDQWAHEG